jgi:hypothetical protein
MQLALPLAGLDAPAPLAWEHLSPGEQAEVVSVLARLMVQLVRSAPEEEQQSDDRRCM